MARALPLYNIENLTLRVQFQLNLNLKWWFAYAKIQLSLLKSLIDSREHIPIPINCHQTPQKPV